MGEIMNFKQYIILMSISCVLAWLTWGFILFGISPLESGIGIFFLFYISLLVALTCSFSILGLVIRVGILRQNQKISTQATRCFRQALLFSILVTVILYFQSKDILNWWTIVLLIAALTLTEFFLISYKEKMDRV